jgi:LuxR family transcriptional regulator, regulator of acetate metabolism
MGDDAGAVRTAVLTLHRVTGLPVVFGGALAGRERFRITELLGNTTAALDGLMISQGSGLGGKAMALSRPVWVSDYPKASTISHDYDGPVTVEGLLSVLAVPVVVRRQVRGVLYGALREPLSLADRVITTAVEVVRDLEQELAVRDEADHRLARLQRSAGVAAPAPQDGSVPQTETARWEEVRALHAELRGLADQVTDADLKARLVEAAARLAAAADPAGPAGPAGTPRPRLSARELDVLSYVAIGGTNADIARQLGLLPETVKSYLRSAMRKLGSHTRLEAVTTARRAGLLP